MKKFLLLIAATLMSVGAYAQTTRTISGAVIDKDGNPIPGALVEATNGADNVTTEADGTFTMEIPYWLKSVTAKYVGMADKKVNVREKNNILIEMSKARAASWFINAAAIMSTDFDDVYGNLGLMGGYMGKWGGYAKLLMPVIIDDIEILPTISLGPIFGLTNNVFLYCGMGYASVYGYDNYYYDGGLEWEPGMIFEVGTMFKFKHFNFSVGLDYQSSFCCYDQLGIQFSVGYCFR